MEVPRKLMKIWHNLVYCCKKRGITVEDYMEMWGNQLGLCALCDRLPAHTGKAGRLWIDHDHQTGKVRGLLCARCNTVIGGLDQPEFRERVWRYLTGSTGPSNVERVEKLLSGS